MKTIHDMQSGRRVTGSHRPLVEPDPVMAALIRIQVDLAVCQKLLAEISEVLGIAYKPTPEECEPDEPF
jgi:hypothetical protein